MISKCGMALYMFFWCPVIITLWICENTSRIRRSLKPPVKPLCNFIRQIGGLTRGPCSPAAQSLLCSLLWRDVGPYGWWFERISLQNQNYSVTSIDTTNWFHPSVVTSTEGHRPSQRLINQEGQDQSSFGASQVDVNGWRWNDHVPWKMRRFFLEDLEDVLATNNTLHGTRHA